VSCHDVGVTLASAAKLRVQICGPLVIQRGDERIEGVLPGRQGRLAFTYLVLNRHRQMSREELAAALWPKATPSAPEAVLNPLLSKIRRALGPETIPSRSTLRLDLPEAWVDLEAATDAIHRAESAVAQGAWARAWGPSQVALFVAERAILAGEEAPWLDDVRRHLGEIRVRALECYATAELGIGGAELNGAVQAARRLTQVAPLRESGHRTLIKALAAQGNLAEALRAYGDLRQTLRDELGISPSPASQALYAHLLAGPR